MLLVWGFLLATLRDSLQTRVGLQAEVLALRHQVFVLQRRNRKRRLQLSVWFVKTKRAELSMQEALCLDGSSYMAWSSSTESFLETSGRGSTAEIQAGIALGS